jgi:dTDP-4-amino-4,6-dideoxygalactose transaminase
MTTIIEKFEKTIADFYGAGYAVSTDSCTHAIELSLRLTKHNNVTCPSQTYLSIPMTLEKLGLDWEFEDNPWRDFYYLGNTNIIDAAVYWKSNGYISNTYMCLSFQFKKHLSLIRGGAILTDDFKSYQTLKKMSVDGRDFNTPWKQQDIQILGYHYYMPVETAKLGLEKFNQSVLTAPTTCDYTEYPYLPDMTVFKQLKNDIRSNN